MGVQAAITTRFRSLSLIYFLRKSAPDVVQREIFLSAIITFGKVLLNLTNSSISRTPAILTPHEQGKTPILTSSGLSLIVNLYRVSS
ncbi:hypothetical protein [Promethearchaeum syntrophicum]|uniref:hypothetical protein n=1 Tax=Promethearchaeum syntrophicum TaxID=2594042 RepID=UPI001FCE7459|nr:hypothetical protein [Candidatus Prometheoarchaeum syntrophicum]